MRIDTVSTVRAYRMRPMPRVTVFIPTYNRAGLLPEAIKSVLGQTYDDFKLVVSDNASDDSTTEIVASFDDPRLEYVRQPENLGLLGNHNWFLQRIETDYALILPDDDLVYPGALERSVAELDRLPRAGVVHADFDVIDENGSVLLPHTNWTYGIEEDKVESAQEFITESMKWSCRVCASTALMRSEALPAGGMSADDFPAIDFGMWLRMAGAGWEFAFVDETLGAYRIHSSSHSAAFGPPQGPGYVQGIEIVSRLMTIKLRFLDTHNGRIAEPQKLQRLAGQARRHELVVLARNLTLPERKPGPTFRALSAAFAPTPSTVREPRLEARRREPARAAWSSGSRKAPRKGGDPRGRLGSRIQEETEIKPKPMVEIGGRPILWHIMRIYAHYGYDEFVGCARLQERLHQALDARVLDPTGRPDLLAQGWAGTRARGEREDWTVALVDIGLATETGYEHVSTSRRGRSRGSFVPPASSRSCSSSSTTTSTS